MQRKRRQNKKQILALLPRRHPFGDFTLLIKNIVFNISNYKLTTNEKFELKHGLNFCLPTGNVRRHEFFAEFAVLFAH